MIRVFLHYITNVSAHNMITSNDANFLSSDTIGEKVKCFVNKVSHTLYLFRYTYLKQQCGTCYNPMSACQWQTKTHQQVHVHLPHLQILLYFININIHLPIRAKVSFKLNIKWTIFLIVIQERKKIIYLTSTCYQNKICIFLAH